MRNGPSAEPPAPEAAQRGPGRARLAALLALALAVAHFASYDIFEQSIVTDVRNYLYFSWQMVEGVPPHLSGFDPKTHLATIVGALLYATGEGLGVDPLIAIRVGYLAIATAGGWLTYCVHKRLGGGPLAGYLGLLAYLSFGLIGGIASVGNSPKLIVAVAASLTALLIHERRWFLAGAASMLAFLDWQIGAVVCIAALASALVCGESRARAGLRVVAGGVLVALPYALYFAAHDALGLALDETFGAALGRGEAFLDQRTFGEHIEHVLKRMRPATGPQRWLFFTGLAGIPVALVRLVQWRRDARLRLLLPLCLVHFGLAGFSLLDFQAKGDAAMLLQSVAFFLGLLWVAVADLLRSLPPVRGSAGLRRGVAAVLLLAVGTAARPSVLRPELPLRTSLVGPRATLSDQRAVAAQVAAATEGRTLGVLQSAEVLFLLRRTNAFPAVYWNVAVVNELGRPGESEDELLVRMIEESGSDAVIFFSARNRGGFGGGWTERRFSSENGEYTLRVSLANPEPAPRER